MAAAADAHAPQAYSYAINAQSTGCGGGGTICDTNWGCSNSCSAICCGPNSCGTYSCGTLPAVPGAVEGAALWAAGWCQGVPLSTSGSWLQGVVRSAPGAPAPATPLRTCPKTLWHMPDGITLLATPKNGNNYYLLFEQPSSGHCHATPCVSSYLWSPSHDFLAFTKSSRHYISPRSEGTYATSSSSSCLHSWCIPHNLRFVTKSPVWRLSSRIRQAISYSSDHSRTLKIFIAEMEF